MIRIFTTFFLSLTLISQDQNIFYKDADIKTFAEDIALLSDKTIILQTFHAQETSTLPSSLPQKLTPWRSGHAGSESEVHNLEILHPRPKLRKTNRTYIIYV